MLRVDEHGSGLVERASVHGRSKERAWFFEILPDDLKLEAGVVKFWNSDLEFRIVAVKLRIHEKKLRIGVWKLEILEFRALNGQLEALNRRLKA